MNTDNNINHTDELDELRAQVAEFKKRLDEQEIVNDRLLRNVVKGKVKSLRKFNIIVYILAALGFVVIAAACLVTKISLWPVVTLALLGVAEGVFTFWNLNKIAGVSEMSVVDAQTQMAAYVRREKWVNVLEVPAILAIVYWAYVCAQDITVPQDIPADLVDATIDGGFVGAIIGTALVFYLFRKQFRMIRNIRKSITALKEEPK